MECTNRQVVQTRQLISKGLAVCKKMYDCIVQGLVTLPTRPDLVEGLQECTARCILHFFDWVVLVCRKMYDCIVQGLGTLPTGVDLVEVLQEADEAEVNEVVASMPRKGDKMNAQDLVAAGAAVPFCLLLLYSLGRDRSARACFYKTLSGGTARAVFNSRTRF